MMHKVSMVLSGNQKIVHSFMSEPEARAYILGVLEMDAMSHVHTWVVSLKLNGHRIKDANPKQRSG